jgi:hypothetical protein
VRVVKQLPKKGSQERLAELCSAFYTYIPHNFGRSKAPLLTLADIQVHRFKLLLPSS